MRHLAVGLNFADTYFRSGLYPAALPAGMGVEGAGVVEAVGSGVNDFVEGDRVTYTGSPLGAYSTERVMSADHLIKLPDAISFDTAAAMTMRGLTTSYLLRRIAPGLKAGDTVLLHAAAGGVGLLFTQWAALLGIKVIGSVSTDAKAAVAKAHGCEHTIVYTREDVATRVREITDGAGVPVVYDSIGRTTYQSSIDSLARRGLLVCFGTASGQVPPINAMELAMKGSLYVTRPALADYIADPAERRRLPASCSSTSAPGASTSRSTSATPSTTPFRPTATSSPARASARPSSTSSPRPEPLAHPTTPSRRPEHPGEPTMSETIDRMPVPPNDVPVPPAASRSTASPASSAPAPQRQPGRRGKRPGRVRRDQGPAAPAQGPLLPRPADQPSRPRQLAERFGPLEGHPVAGSDPEHPGLVRIYKDLDSPAEHYENAFHCDATWREAPPMGSVLRCVQGPAVGGDTIWVDMVQAYERLPEHIKTQIAGLRARHSIESTFGASHADREASRAQGDVPRRGAPGRADPPGDRREGAVRQRLHDALHELPHRANVRYGHDYSPGGSELLNYLIRQASIPEYQVRWRWRKDSLAIWDNRYTQHYAVQDYWPAVRKMERAGIVGDKTF